MCAEQMQDRVDSGVLEVALELLEMEREVASFSLGPILFAFPALAHSFLLCGRLPPAPGLKFPHL